MKISHLFKILVFALIFLHVFTAINALSVSSYIENQDGVTFTMNQGKMKVQVCQSDIIRVMYTLNSSIPSKTSLSVNKSWGTPGFSQSESGGIVTIQTSRIKVKVTLSNGSITYTDLNDNVILSEDSTNSKTITPVSVEGVSTNKVEALFNSPSNEALYGIGQTQDSVMNRKGTTSHMLNGNSWIYVPTLVSNKGYGIFWDNYSTTDFSGNVSGNTKYRFSSECGDMVDYYFFYGPGIDQVVARYREATGDAPLFPKWAYGLFQSKDKYTSQSELLSIKDGYRNNNIPIDCIVQDWDYWTPYTWGSHFMDESRYPDPASLINQMHTANIHTMISIWPEYEYTSSPRKAGDQDNYNALNAIGSLFPSGGNHHFYDTFNTNARTLVYQQIYDRLVGKYGWDGIWADNTEPQPYPDSINMRSVNTALGKGAFYINAYPLQHSKALYEGWRAVGPNQKRVYVLTRSGYGGQQRYATTCWSGDINCDFATYTKQIPAGLNFSIAGMPYWTTDIGGYWGHPGRVDWTTNASNELFTRWFQYGAFCPIFRIHGGGSRELYGNQWSSTTKANLLMIDNLRYRLMPYIYSLAWKVTSEGYSIMRPLVFDYQNDTNVFNIKDQFLFGPAFLVNPVTSAGATSRSVYLPSGTWYDFWTGSTISGGRSTSVSAPLNRIPLFIKAGSIVPMGPNIQYATQSIDPLEIRVYKGQDCSFTLYEDQGDTYNYESGQYATIEFSWNEAAQQLSIGARSGSYTGMPANRTFNIVYVSSNHGNGVDVSSADDVINYNGSQVGPTLEPTPEPTPDQTAGPTPTPNQEPIFIDGPYTLNGTTDYVDLPDGLTNDLNDFSIACRVNLNSIPNWVRIFDFGGDTNIFMMLTPASGTTGYPYFCITLNGNDGEQGLNGTSTFPTGSDQHFAITKSGNTAILYINGEEVDRNTNMTLNPSDMGNTLNNYIGKSQWEQDPYLDGEVDEFFVYNRAISATEVADLANSSGITPEPTATPGTGTPGDTNGDGTVDIVDALLIAQYYVDLDPANFIPENADVNCDDSVDIIDALLIAQYYVGLINGFC